VLAFAAVLLVDRQTGASRTQRSADAAQTLAEGVLTSAASVLAGDDGYAEWSTQFPLSPEGRLVCTTVAGDLRAPATTPVPTPLEAAVRSEVRAFFRAAEEGDAPLSDYDEKAARRTVWRVEICPSQDAGTSVDVEWSDANLRRPSAVPVRTGVVGVQKTLWVRAQADIRAVDSGASPDPATTTRSRAVAAKVQQDGALFTPPKTVAIGTGAFSTDLGATVGGLLDGVTNNPVLLNGVLGKVLGTDGPGLVEDRQSEIGVRCGIANGLQNLTDPVLAGKPVEQAPLNLNLCVGGVFAGLNGLTENVPVVGRTVDSLLDSVLGTGQFTNLTSMTMAPGPAIEGYREASKSAAGVHVSSDDPIPGGTKENPPACDLPWSRLAPSGSPASLSSTVVFIEQIGDGADNGYCMIPDGRNVAAKAFVVERGGIVLRGAPATPGTPTLTSVLYMLNAQECDGAPSEGCTSAHRRTQKARELVRIEGDAQVVGSVWTDGARSRVGIYPAEPTQQQLDGALGPLLQGLTRPVDNLLCRLQNGLPLIGPVVGVVADLVGTVLTGVINVLVDGQAVAVPIGDGPPTNYFYRENPRPSQAEACAILARSLAALAPADLLGLLDEGGTTPPVGMTVWKRTCVVFNLVCGPWRDEPRTAAGVPVAGGVLDTVLGLGTTLTDLVNGLTQPWDDHTAVRRDPLVIAHAAITMPDNAAFVPGTFRNVPPTPSVVP
jgi:hypothetical protein